MENLIKLVQEWANDKGLNKPEQLKVQLLKISEELGEMNAALLRISKPAERFIQIPKLIDGIGDLQVTYIVLCNMAGLDYASIYALPLQDTIKDADANDWALNIFKWAGNTGEAMQSLDEIEINIASIKGGIAEICRLFDLTPRQCLQSAYDEIKGRTGQLVNGTFIKDEPSALAKDEPKPSEVDLSELEKGNTIEYRHGGSDEVISFEVQENGMYEIESKGDVDIYHKNGNWLDNGNLSKFDIVRIIKA